MKISDKAIGYISFVAIVLIIVGVSLGMWNAHKGSSTTAIIDFDELGALSPEDPMTENGYEIGKVASVEWLGDRSRVTVIFDNPVTLREGSYFRNASFALMGGRRIELVRTHEGEILPPDHVFRGEFVPGITESLRFISVIHEQAKVSRDAILAILEGSESDPGVVQKYNETMQNVENLLNQFDKTASTAGFKIQEILAQAEAAAQTLDQTANTADSSIGQATVLAKNAISSTQKAFVKLSTELEKIEAITRAAQENPTLQNLLETQETVQSVNTLHQKLNEFIQSINTKGIALYDSSGNKVKLIHWKNINLIGKTARQKAKERQKKSPNTP